MLILAALMALAVLVAGFALGMLSPPIVLDKSFRREFFTSAGFGGLTALAAAIIAYIATRRSAKSARDQAETDRAYSERRDRKAQWWARAEWALTQVVSDRGVSAGVGIAVLEALGQSEWADEHEADVIAAALAFALDAVALPARHDGTSAPVQTRGADGSTAEPTSGTMEAGGNDD